jgi:dTDP-4-amino-4,6-dideoxygalactose transaminase
MSWKIPLSDIDIDDKEIEAVSNVLKSKWLTMGSVTSEFEKKFAEKMNVKHCFAVNNCTAALHLANVILGIDKDAEVICPALTFVASANGTRYTGGRVVFADSISQKDLTIDPKDIEKKITSKTKAITVVHYGGFPCLMEEIMEIAEKHKLFVIEDCAHAPFAWTTIKNEKKFVGTIGDVGCFSFFGNKNMTTGEGGMITTNSDELAEKLRLTRSHGMTTLTYQRHTGHASNYDVVTLGYNYRTDEMHSALGLAQLEKIDQLNAGRRRAFKDYIEAFQNKTNVVVPFTNRNVEESTCHIMPVILKENYNEIKQKLKDAGIQTSKHYDLIPKFSDFKGTDFHSKIEKIENILTLPLFPTLKKDQIQEISTFFN